ncbi:TIGR03118 family protein [Mucilaginibacter sp. L3T2-6]|uniref:TIGR03118 family protein n=1 Tax=Mucilaginibacter sp. L3T2-6 TaxID=3062491 RepID=UPI0026762EC5|nr:TIGR03118 family protein [Mucilaginibacter sp. L3T2-6]MDO3641759.1 TIGR03118 family protein [Mucilaginibacter sp. L3T2-6]MDV6214253.1 TIGR03118 family protein [Mucilaginibacter sp. L3T2-6]
MKRRIVTNLMLLTAAVASSIYSCKKEHNTTSTGPVYNITQTNLVADFTGANAAKTDTNLVNAWGLAANPNGIIWVSSNHKSVSTVYDSTGSTLRPPVNIPQSGSPTGIVFNSTADFSGSKFIFAGEDGVITAWTAGNEAVPVLGAAGGVYKGLAMGSVNNINYLYAANFKGGKIDVIDKDFNYVPANSFKDPNLPAGFAPFNIQNIGGMLYVTYAKLKGPDNEDDDAAPGNGYVNIFKPDGTFVRRFASQGALNSPWGITRAPAGFAAATETILVGNFGDGKINIFDVNGNYKGQLQKDGKPVSIEGLWALDFLKTNPVASSKLYFTAGPGDESHGVLGYLKSSFSAGTGSSGRTSGGY